jgi:TPP-dependent pyruvate/acetoin dehydrogenase alpha subunit
MLPDITRDKQLAILRKMLMIRRAEEHCIRFHEEHHGLIRGHFHVYIGQEATGVAVCESLNNDDYVFTTHRNHGHVIAKGGDPKKVLAEIIGRATGYCQGRAGTFHVAAPDVGIVHTSAIVGGCLALAAGTAYAAQMQQSKAFTVVFFGDGAMEEGVFYEVLNIAKLWQLPLIFWMENNYRRIGRGAGHAATELTNVPKALNVETTLIDGIDVGTVYKTAAEIVRRTRAGEGPLFVEARTRLWPGNAFAMPKLVGGITNIAWAWDAGAAPENVRDWHKDCDPILTYIRELEGGGVSRGDIENIDAQVRQKADEAARFALESPLPEPKAALNYAFAGKGN